MKQLKTKAIVLARINYGETDRIISVITPDYGKLRLMARGTRALKSKLAGGIELFSINDISFIRGKSDIATLISSRLDKNFGAILNDIDRVQFGYEMLKTVNKVTEDEAEADFFHLLAAAFEGLNDQNLSLGLAQAWFWAHLIEISGHAPNLTTDNKGEPLDTGSSYSFDNESMAFSKQQSAKFQANDIKFMRVVFNCETPRPLGRITGGDDFAAKVMPLLNLMQLNHL